MRALCDPGCCSRPRPPTCLGTHPPLAPAPWSLCMSFARPDRTSCLCPSSLLRPAQALPPGLPGRAEGPPPFGSSIVCLAPWVLMPLGPDSPLWAASLLNLSLDPRGAQPFTRTWTPTARRCQWSAGQSGVEQQPLCSSEWSLLGSLWAGCPCHHSPRSYPFSSVSPDQSLCHT